MTGFRPVSISVEAQDDLRADARAEMFFALRTAFQKRSKENGLKPRDLSDILDKNKSYISRVLNGTQASIDFETLTVFMHALGYHLPIIPVAFEDLLSKNSNFDARSTLCRVEAATRPNIYEVRYAAKPSNGLEMRNVYSSHPVRKIKATYEMPEVVS